MKTAEEVLQEHRRKDGASHHWITNKYAIDAMKVYGRQCAEQALKDAFKRLSSPDTMGMHSRDKILSTPILTP